MAGGGGAEGFVVPGGLPGAPDSVLVAVAVAVAVPVGA